MAAVRIREDRRDQHPSSRYNGMHPSDQDNMPVAYTADQLMRQLVKRQAENAPPPQEDSSSYMSDVLTGSVPGLQSVNYEKYRPSQEYSYAERLAMLKAAPPESRAMILELTAPRKRKMKKGFSAFAEALMPAALTGINHANTKKDERKTAQAEARRIAADEEAKNSRLMEREFLKGLLKKEANAEKQLGARKIAEMKAGATRYAADRNYDGKLLKGANGAHGGSDLDDINAEIENTDKLLEETGDKGQVGALQNLVNKVTPFNWGLSPEQAAVKAQEDALKLKIAKHMQSNRNQTEFEHTPSISSRNSPEANKAIINQLRSNFNKDKVLMVDPRTGKEGYVPQASIKAAEQKGLKKK